MADAEVSRGAAGMALAGWLATLLGLSGMYMLFAGEVSGTEALAGLVSVAAAMVFAWVAQRAEKRFFRFRLGWVALLARLPVALARDTVVVGAWLVRSIWRPVEGGLARQNFDHGDASGEAGARRALVVLGASLAPNGYVVRVPARGDFFLVHRLAPAPLAADEEWPV